MAIPRESVDGSSPDGGTGYLNESETQHRYAHALLKHNNLYFLFTSEDIKTMLTELPIKFTGTYFSNGKTKKGQFTATFKLVPVPGTAPRLYAYQFNGNLS